MANFLVRYDSRVVIYERKMFIRLATVQSMPLESIFTGVIVFLHRYKPEILDNNCCFHVFSLSLSRSFFCKLQMQEPN